jgi:uncharacterized protein (TIGR04255 family)
MNEGTVASPFGNEDLNEISLAQPPLDLTLVQIRYPRLSRLANDDQFITRFANAVADNYPIFDPVQQAVGLLIGPEGIKQTQETAKIWRIRSADDDWTVSITDNFLALQVKSYPGRTRLRENLSALLAPFLEIIAPPYVERLGVRYINRIHEPEILDRLPSMVRTEALGTVSVSLPESVTLNHNISESLYILGNQMLQVKSGYLSSGVGHDPIISIADHPTWILDLDAFSSIKTPSTVTDIDSLCEELASIVYRYFRWAVTWDFLESYGGKRASQH